MESQPSQPSLSLRQAIPTRPSAAIAAAAVAAASNTASNPYNLPVELMMYSNPRPIIPSLHLPNCLFSNQFCSCLYGAPSHTCNVHHAPIAYGQASSSFIAPTSSSTTPAVALSTGIPEHSTLPSVSMLASGGSAEDISTRVRRDTRLPSTLVPPIRSSVRLKRNAPSLPTQVQTAMEEAERAPKLRRLPTEGNREIQTVASETMQQPPVPIMPVAPLTQEPALPPSTSQLVTGPVPSTHIACSRCHGSSPGQCTSCPTTCQCAAFCPAMGAARTTIVQPAASRNNFVVAGQANPIPQFFASPSSQSTIQHHAEQILQNNIRLRQQQQIHQQVLLNNAVSQQYRLSYLANGQLYVPVRNTHLGLEAFLVNVTHPDFLLDRPLERHHMFAAPVTEPQPIGCTLQEIEKYSEKLQFVKDCEIPETEQERCIVCQCELETGDEIRNLSCNHQFHVECIDRWLGYNKKCPVCRLDIDQPKKAVWIE